MFGRTREGTVGASSPPGLEKVAFAPRAESDSKRRRDFPLQKTECPPPGGHSGGTADFLIRPEPVWLGAFLIVRETSRHGISD